MEPGWNGDEVSEDGLMQGGIGAGFRPTVGKFEPVSARVDEVGEGGWVVEKSRSLAAPPMVGGREESSRLEVAHHCHNVHVLFSSPESWTFFCVPIWSMLSSYTFTCFQILSRLQICPRIPETGLDTAASSIDEDGEGGRGGVEAEHSRPLGLVHEGRTVFGQRILGRGGCCHQPSQEQQAFCPQGEPHVLS